MPAGFYLPLLAHGGKAKAGLGWKSSLFASSSKAHRGFARMSDEKPSFSDLRPGDVIDGFRLMERLHVGGMAHLWRVTRDDMSPPAILKTPIVQDGDDATAIVSFEMEQMILPLLTGPHAPKFIASGDFSRQPYIVMELIEGASLLGRVDDAPLPVAEVVEIGVGWRARWPTCTARTSSISTSSRPTSCATDGRRIHAHRLRPVAPRSCCPTCWPRNSACRSAPAPICRRSRSRATAATRAAIFSRSAWCFITC